MPPQTAPLEAPRAAPAAPIRDPAAPSRLKLILMLGAITAFAPLSIDMYLPALPALSRDFGTGPSEVQLTLSAFFFGLPNVSTRRSARVAERADWAAS